MEVIQYLCYCSHKKKRINMKDQLLINGKALRSQCGTSGFIPAAGVLHREPAAARLSLSVT